MKIIVFFDSHGCEYNMREVMKRNRADTELVIHLGDGSEDVDHVMADYQGIATVKMAGNREEYLGFLMTGDLMIEDLFSVGGKWIFASHGHKYHVKSGDGGIVYHALDCGADIVLYGHTHEATCRDHTSEESGRTLHIMNPGTIGASSHPTYGEIIIDGDSVTMTVKDA